MPDYGPRPLRYVTLCCRDEEEVAWIQLLCFRCAVYAPALYFRIILRKHSPEYTFLVPNRTLNVFLIL